MDVIKCVKWNLVLIVGLIVKKLLILVLYLKSINQIRNLINKEL